MSAEEVVRKMAAHRPSQGGNPATAVDDLLLLLGDEGDPAQPQGRPGRGRRVAVCTLLVGILIAMAAGTLLVVSESLGDNVARLPDVFVGLDESIRPPATGAMTIVLVGTDTRADVPTTGEDAGESVGGDRSDVVMVARIDPSRTSASVVSIPRDSWVDVPGRGLSKINAAYAWGGPSLLVQTVEGLTNLRVDHFAVIDFAGFESMVDAVGGIDVGVSAATSNIGVEFRQGVNHLDGAQALAFVRQRYGLANGDLDRAQRQQAALRALLAKAASNGMLADPVGLYRLVDATTRSVSVDDTLTNGGLRALGYELRGLRSAGMMFLLAPVGGLGREGSQSVVYLDQARSEELWTALREGRGSDYADRHPDDTLGPTTR